MICQCFMRIFLRFKIRCGRVISGNKQLNFFRSLCFVTKSLCSPGEMNFSQDFMDEGSGIASVTESLRKVSFALIKILLDWVGSQKT